MNQSVFIYAQNAKRRNETFLAFVESIEKIKADKINLFVISNDFFLQEIACLNLNYDMVNQINYLFQWLKKQKQYYKVLVIDDLSMISSIFSLVNDLIELIKNQAKLNLAVFVGSSSLNEINQRLLSQFHIKISLDRLSRLDQLTFYLKANDSMTMHSSILTSHQIYDYEPIQPECLNSKHVNEFNLVNPLRIMDERIKINDYTYSFFPLGISYQSAQILEVSSTKNVLILSMYSDVLNCYLRMINKDPNLKHFYILLSDYLICSTDERQKMFDLLNNEKTILIGLYFDYCKTTLRNQIFFEEVIWLGPGFSQQSLIPLNGNKTIESEKEGIKMSNGKIESFRCFDE